MSSPHELGRTLWLLSCGVLAIAACSRSPSQDAKQRASAAAASQAMASSQPEALDPEAASGKQALERWAGHAKAILGALPAARELKPGCDTLESQAPLESVDSSLLESVRRSPNGAVPTLGASGFASLQSRAVRGIFHTAHAGGSASMKKANAAGVELDAAKLLAVFDLSEVDQPRMLSKDTYAGGGIQGAVVIFDLAHDTAVCRIPLQAKAPSKSEAVKRYGEVDTSSPSLDMQRQVLEWTAMDLRKKAEAALSKLPSPVKLAANETS